MILTYNYGGDTDIYGEDSEYDVDPLKDGVYGQMLQDEREEMIHIIFDEILTDKEKAEIKASFGEDDFPEIKTMEDVVKWYTDKENSKEADELISEYEEDLMEDSDWFSHYVYAQYEEEARDAYEG